MRAPRLTFFCELGAAPLRALFADPAVLGELVALEARVSLGLVDLSPKRAEVVRQLGQAGVPVIAWLLLPEAQGYWFNRDNAVHATTRYADFLAWTAEHGLQWNGVGLDIEPDIHELQRMLAGRWLRLPALLPGLLRGERLHRALAEYRALVARIRAEGYRVDTYQMPFIVDDRRAQATLLQRLTGVLDLPADREVLMLYSSFVRPHGPGVLWSYGPEAQSIAVGSTGGGVEVPGLIDVPPLSWDELTRDLRLARRLCEDLHLFSLEGCVRQGFLSRLRAFDWEGPVDVPYKQAGRLDRLRRAASLGLRASARLLR